MQNIIDFAWQYEKLGLTLQTFKKTIKFKGIEEKEIFN
jgi:hypothetical protein